MPRCRRRTFADEALAVSNFGQSREVNSRDQARDAPALAPENLSRPRLVTAGVVGALLRRLRPTPGRITVPRVPCREIKGDNGWSDRVCDAQPAPGPPSSGWRQGCLRTPPILKLGAPHALQSSWLERPRLRYLASDAKNSAGNMKIGRGMRKSARAANINLRLRSLLRARSSTAHFAICLSHVSHRQHVEHYTRARFKD
jgi:hypothetical protein